MEAPGPIACEESVALAKFLKPQIEQQRHLQTRKIMTAFSAGLLADEDCIQECVRCIDSSIPDEVLIGLFGLMFDTTGRGVLPKAQMLLEHENYYVRMRSRRSRRVPGRLMCSWTNKST
jgi:hypothetical protein